MTSDRQHLTFIYARLRHVHGESENYDYMLRLQEIIRNQPVEDGFELQPDGSLMPVDPVDTVGDAHE